MYVLIENNAVKQYPYGADVLRRENPQISFPNNPTDEMLAAFNVFPVKPTERPEFDAMNQKLDEGTPEKVAGSWVQVWNVSPLSAEEVALQQQALRASIVAYTQLRLDSFAQTRGYDGILSACSYATSTVPKFQSEGQYCVEARDMTWAKLADMLAEVEAGTRPVPSSFADIEPELPSLQWPA